MLGSILAQAESTGLNFQFNAQQFITSAIYVGFGMLLFAVAFFIMCKVAPFSVQKEIEEDQNTSLAILMGSVIIGIAIIVGSAVSG